MTWKYFHRVGYHVSYLDAAVLPEVGAMFAAMMSRSPKGGIEARYREVVGKIAKSIHPHDRAFNIKDSPWYHGERECWVSAGEGDSDGLKFTVQYVDAADEQVVKSEDLTAHLSVAEEYLVKYTDGKLHPVIQEFFDQFVLKYGHGSIKELTGKPVVFIEHISIWFAYMTFDNPQVRGQEMSTRAIWRPDWALGHDAYTNEWVETSADINPQVFKFHRLGLEIAKHEIEAWKKDFRAPCEECGGEKYLGKGYTNPMYLGGKDFGRETVECHVCQGTGKKHPTFDPQASAFRPAFDQARWALPGSIETGVAHAADVRVMGRVIQQMENIAQASGQASALRILEEVKEGYRRALPGMEGMWMREAVHDSAKPGFKPDGTLDLSEDITLLKNFYQQALDGIDITPEMVKALDPDDSFMRVEFNKDGEIEADSAEGVKAAINKILKGYSSHDPRFDALGKILADSAQGKIAEALKTEEGQQALGDALREPIEKNLEEARRKQVVEGGPGKIKILHGSETIGVVSEIRPSDREVVPINTLEELRDQATVISKIPGHLRIDKFVEDSRDVHLVVNFNRGEHDLEQAAPMARPHRRAYVDPYWNHFAQVDWDIRNSWACCRDWHRHRTSYPIRLRVVREKLRHLYARAEDVDGVPAFVFARPGNWGLEDNRKYPAGYKIEGKDRTMILQEDAEFVDYKPLQLDHHYEPISDFGIANWQRYFEMATELFDKYIAEGNLWMAMCCLPLGTRMEQRGQTGLGHAIYTFELRCGGGPQEKTPDGKDDFGTCKRGVNFEYAEHAWTALKKMTERISKHTNGDALIKMLALDQEPE